MIFLKKRAKETYSTLEEFFAALASGELSADDVAMHFDCNTFFAMDEEHECISGDFEEVYAYFKLLLKNAKVAIIQEES